MYLEKVIELARPKRDHIGTADSINSNCGYEQRQGSPSPTEESWHYGSIPNGI